MLVGRRIIQPSKFNNISATFPKNFWYCGIYFKNFNGSDIKNVLFYRNNNKNCCYCGIYFPKFYGVWLEQCVLFFEQLLENFKDKCRISEYIR